MKSTPSFTICAILLMVLAGPFGPAALAEDDGQSSVEIGVWDDSVEGSPDVALEYEPDGGGIDLGLDVETFNDGGSFLVSAHVRDEDDLVVDLDFDVNRSIRSHTAYTGLLHRLGHDPMSNLEAVTNHGRVTYHTDLDPLMEYITTYSDLDHRTEFQPRGASALTVAVNYRVQDRGGHRQAMTISHCDACHVYSQSRPVDESTEDAGADALITWGGGQLKASFNHRTYEEDTRLTLLFDDALHPELRRPVFDNRLQFDSAEGPQAVHVDPDVTKDVGKIDLAFGDVGGFALNFDAVWSTTENEVTGLEADYSGFMISAARNFGNGWKMRWRGRSYSIDNDEIFVDAVERLGIAGAQAGRTYREVYGFDPDFLRLSALDRDVIESKLDFAYKISKKAGTVKFLWDFESIDRDHYQVAPGETETTENVFGVTWWARPKKGLRVNAALRHGDVDNPFMLVDGRFSTLVSAQVPNPFHPNAAQYYEFHAARIADTTASPDSWDELKLGMSYTLRENDQLTASFRYWDGDNGSQDLTDWSRTTQAFTFGYWAVPAPEWQWYLSYTHHDSELDFPSSVPIFDG